MLYPVLRLFRLHYPDTRLELLTLPMMASVFSDIPQVHIIEFDKRKYGSLPGLWRLYRKLAAREYLAVLDLHNVLRSRFLSALLGLRGLKVYRLDKGRAERRRLLTATFAGSKPLKSVHQRYADVFERAGYPLDWPPESGERTGSIRTRTGLPERIVGIAPFARHPGKAYPTDLMRQVVEELLSVPDLRVSLFGAPGEEASLLESWAQRWPGRVGNLAYGVSFADQLRHMKELSLMISMDSANGHLASNAGVPVLTVWGTTHPLAGFTPYGQPADHQITPDTRDYPLLPVSIYGPVRDESYLRAIQSIPPERIVRKAKEILECEEGN